MGAMDQALLERIELLARERSERGVDEPRGAAFLDLSPRELRNYSLTRAIRSILPNPGQLAAKDGLEAECTRTIRQRLEKQGRDPRDASVTDQLCIGGGVLVPREVLNRAMATQPGSKGGFLVGNSTIGFTDALRARSVVLRMGARELNDLVGNISAGRETSTVTASWQAGDGTSISAADQALGQLSMTAKTCVAITDVSEQLIRQTSPSVDTFIGLDLGAAVATAVDAAALNGAGGAQPLGIKNTPLVNTSQDLSSASYTKVQAIVQAAGTANAIRGNPGWVSNSAGAGIFMSRQRFTATDSPIWTGNIADGQLVGFPAMSSEQIASGNAMFGSWDELVVGDWGVLELTADRGGTRFNQGLVGIRALWMVDVMLRYPAAFYVSTNLS